MKAKEFLDRLRNQDNLIEQYTDMLKTIEQRMKYIGVSFDSIRQSQKNTTSPQEKLMCKYISLQDKVKELLASFIETEEEIITVINQIDNNISKEVMIRRYIKREEWNCIAKDMNYSISAIFRINQLSLKEIDKILEKQ